MSKPIAIYWDSTSALIANEQDVTEDKFFKLITNVPDYSGAFEYDSVIRNITITATGSTAANRFLIKGIGVIPDGEGQPDGILRPIEETVTGDADGSVTSANLYSRIDSIQVLDDNIDDCSVFYGPSGITQYIFADYNRATVQALSTSYSLQFTSAGEISVGIYASLNRPETPTKYGNLKPFSLGDGSFLHAFQILAPTHTNSIGTIDNGCSVIWAKVDATNNDSTFLFTVLQQGIR